MLAPSLDHIVGNTLCFYMLPRMMQAASREFKTPVTVAPPPDGQPPPALKELTWHEMNGVRLRDSLALLANENDVFTLTEVSV